VILSDSGWKQATLHQYVRVVKLDLDASLGQAAEVVKGFGDPFGGRGTIETIIRCGNEMVVYAIKHGAH